MPRVSVWLASCCIIWNLTAIPKVKAKFQIMADVSDREQNSPLRRGQTQKELFSNLFAQVERALELAHTVHRQPLVYYYNINSSNNDVIRK